MIGSHREELLEQRYLYPVGKLMGVVREDLKWADGKIIKEMTNKEVLVKYCKWL